MSGIKNFFIVFAICFIIFGLLGLFVLYPFLHDAFITDPDVGNNSEEGSHSPSDVSEPEESGTIIYDGDTFSAVFIGLAPDGLAASIIYMCADEGARTFTYSYFSPEAPSVNNVGIETPMKYLFPQYISSGNEVTKRVAAYVGSRVDYYVFLGEEELVAIVNKMNSPFISLNNEIKYLNPIYAETVEQLEEGEQIPEEFYIKIPMGNNIINEDLVRAIYGYNPYPDGSEYHTMIKLLHESVFSQFFTNSGTKKNTAALNQLFSVVKSTNITPSVLEEQMNLIFTYDIYKLTPVTFRSDWTQSVKDFKQDD